MAKVHQKSSARRCISYTGFTESPDDVRQVVVAKTTEDMRKYAVEQGIVEEEALKKGMEEKAREFVDNGATINAKL